MTIPAAIKAVSGELFEGCKNLESVTFEPGVESIGIFAFSRCGKLKTVNLPESVKSIAKNAFRGCPCEAQLKKDHPELIK